MKTKRTTFAGALLTVCNTVAGAYVDGLNIAAGAFAELTLKEGEQEWRGEFMRYGEYPATIIENGRPKRIVQVVDREAANEMATNFAGLRTQVATFFKGIGVFEGHADDPAWRAVNPGYKPAAVGRIKEVIAGTAGIETRTVFNSKGAAMLSGEAPEYSGHSPRWRMRPIPGRPNHYRPFLLLSDALTNDPNIPGAAIALNESPANGHEGTNETNEPTMNEELLKRLGLKPGATQAEIDAKVATALNERDTARNELTTSASNLTAANERIQKLETKAAEDLNDRVVTALNDAVTNKRITEAEKPTWEKILKADFDAGKSALDAKTATALNTTNHVADLGRRQGEGAPAAPGIEAMQAAARDYAGRNHIDINNEAGWSRAWEGAKAEKPELFGVKKS
ncbi:phage protease [Haloferula sargassicola]|uniref:Uncharacterized protein n=1 Tax=Haloferula sargassicola TaxID=490096 RepID=A0ABP9UN02_9BACT